MASMFDKEIGYHEWMFLDSEVEKNSGKTVAEVVESNLSNNFALKSIQKGTSGGRYFTTVINTEFVQMSERDLVVLGGMYVAFILNGLMGPRKTFMEHSKLTEFGESYTFAVLAGMLFAMPFDVTVKNESEFESDVSEIKESVLKKLGHFIGRSFLPRSSILKNPIMLGVLVSRPFIMADMDRKFSKKAEVWAKNLSEAIDR